MNYSIIPVWHVYISGNDNTGRGSADIGYFDSKEKAKIAAGNYYDIWENEAIKIGNEYFLLSSTKGNKPMAVK